MREAAAAVRATWALPGTRMGAWTHFTTSFGPGVFGLLWGYPFLVKGEGLDPTLAGWLLIAMTGASAVAGPLIGRFTARRPIHRADLVLGIVGAISAAWVMLLAWPGPAPLGVIVTVLLVTAVGGPGSGVAFDMARAFNPQERIGKALSIVSIGGFTAMLAAMAVSYTHLDVYKRQRSTRSRPCRRSARRAWRHRGRSSRSPIWPSRRPVASGPR